MANLTRKEIRDLVRDLVGQQDHAIIRDGVLDQMINNSIWKVQQDLIALNLKTFTKQAVLQGNVVAVPSDMLAIPNAIIELKGASGTLGGTALTMTGAGATFTFSAIEVGTGHDWSIFFTTGSSVALTSLNPSTKVAYIRYISATTTAQQLLDFLNANVLFRSFFREITTTGTLSGLVNIGTNENVIPEGSGTGFYPAEEVSVEDFNRQDYNTFLTPTETNIVYVRTGNYDGDSVIQFKPLTINYAYIYYHYRLPALASDTDAHSFPIEYEELLLVDIQTKCYSRLKFLEGVNEKSIEYDKKLQMVRDNYKMLLDEKRAEKSRLTAEKPND